MFTLTIEDAKRLLPESDFQSLLEIYGDDLAETLSKAQQPPEVGMVSDDESLKAMLADVVAESVIRHAPKIIRMGVIDRLEGESQSDFESRLETLVGGKILRFN